MRTKQCRDCNATVFWWQTPAGRWQTYAATPIPYEGVGVGVVAHKRRGLIDASTAWPEPPWIFPIHFHPRRREVGPHHVSTVFDEWLTTQQRKPPRGRRSSKSTTA